ncbi:CAAX prenyl protease 2 [Trichinella papuae]|uniref:CAAX prenyl protease 2 n=1 Tax=Trichinella papuae TaxID=268474 RepID=A0A0V1N8R0_9BILA|nr:CAAX prenyl protease 2 [Trichinella papuae]
MKHFYNIYIYIYVSTLWYKNYFIVESMSLEAILFLQSAPLLFVSLTRLFSCGNGCRRFTGSLFASIISAVVAQLWRPKNMDPFEYLGLRLQGLLPAFMLPLLLTTAPLCEEMVFRCCMVSVAASCFQPFSVVLLMPIYFAAAHLHHALDKTDFVCGWRQILRVHCDRLIITYLFGVYNTFIYLRTHHFISAFVCHALCNFIGFPEPEMYYSLKARWKRSLVLYLTFIGILLWMMSLYPLTNPSLYGNKLFVL